VSHYYRPRGRRYRGVWVVADTLRGVTVEFRVSGDVFSADEIDEGTRLLVEHARVPEEGVVLDLGCGYGVIDLFSRSFARRGTVQIVRNSETRNDRIH